MEDWSLPPSWTTTKIVEVLTPNSNGKPFQQGFSPQCDSRAAEPHEWGVLKTTAIQENDFWDNQNKRLPDAIPPRAHLEVASGDILMTCAGPRSRCGVACFVRRTRSKLLLSGKMYRFRADPEGMESRFLMHFLATRQAQAAIDRMKTGINDSGLNLTHDRFSELDIPVAPLNEQRRIVEKIETLFARLDKGEEALRDVQKLLARYRQSVLKAAVTGQLTGSDSATWKPVTLGDLLEDIRYGTAKKCRPDVEGVAVLRIPNVANGEIDLQDLKYTQLDDREIRTLGLKKGDLLIVRSNGSANLVGRGAVVNDDAVGLAFAGYLIRLRVDRKRLLPDFLQLVLSSPVVRARIERQARSTSGVHNINSGEVKAIAFDLPPVEVQAQLIELVDEHMAKTGDLEAWCQTELARSAALRQSILKDAFAGRLVPQDPTDEPAAALLARIKETHAAAPRRVRKPKA